MEQEKVPAGGDEPTETSAGDMSARVTIEVNGHSEIPVVEKGSDDVVATPQIEDDEEAA